MMMIVIIITIINPTYSKEQSNMLRHETTYINNDVILTIRTKLKANSSGLYMAKMVSLQMTSYRPQAY